MEEAARCLLCHDAPCSEGCPAGTDPGKFIRSIRFRNPKGAAETIRENNVLGGVCARVCPYDRLCEEACSRTGIDRPIEIGKLQRYAVEQEKAFRMKVLKAPRGRKNQGAVACVGAGPASLALAAELAKAGYRVTIFEKEKKAGGVLTYGITPARLPQYVVDQDIAAVKGLGVEFEFGTEIGKKITAQDLIEQKGYDAVFIGAGLWQGRSAGVPGEDLKGVLTAVDFLKEARTKGGYAAMKDKTVVVVGGGDVAMDCATTAKLSGAAKVAIWYRRSVEEAPASMDEIRYAHDLGITITTEFAPKAFTGKGKKVEYAEFTGRDKKSSATAACDFVVLAIGQTAEDMSKITGASLSGKGCIAVRKGGKTNLPGIFAAGDIANGGKTVVEAVAEGKEAAASIITYLKKKAVKPAKKAVK
jgi:dihydropyrimidine dehydrogenase (NAD+) subunit PreT